MGMSPEYHPDTSMTCQVAAEARQVPPFFFLDERSAVALLAPEIPSF